MPVFNVCAEPLAKGSRHLAVNLLCRLVNVDFPADTTSVAASRSDTLELVIKIGLSKNHLFRFLVGKQAEYFALDKPTDTEEGERNGFGDKNLCVERRKEN